jgi:hypothetical protein
MLLVRELKQLIFVMGRTMNYPELKESDAAQIKSIFDVVQDYTYICIYYGTQKIHTFFQRPAGSRGLG